MDRFRRIVRQANDDGSETVRRFLTTLDIVIEHAVRCWPEAIRVWADDFRGLRAVLHSKGVGDCYEGPDYMAVGRIPSQDRIVFLGDLGDLQNSADEGPIVPVTMSGRYRC
jgi:hypothetical protein